MRSMVEGQRRRPRIVLNTAAGRDWRSGSDRQDRRYPSVRLRLTAPRERGAPGYSPFRRGIRSGNTGSRPSCLAAKVSAMCGPENMPVCQTAM